MARAMRKSGGYEYTPEERSFADTLQKTIDTSRKLLSPDKVQTDHSEAAGPASSDVGDVSWVVPTAEFTAATFVPGVGAHTWQAAACAGSSIGRKGMVVAARTLALAAVELFETPAELDAAKTDFEKRRAGRQWTTHIAAGSKPPLDHAVKN